MENLKIRVNNEAESKEVQDFAKSDGYSRKYNNFSLHKGWVCLNSEKDILCVCHSQAGNELDDYKEITLPELRDLVVLKRNDVGDATHWHVTGKANLPYLFLSKEWYFFGRNGWEKSIHSQDFYSRLKPITKEPVMKEYLNKLTDGTYKLVVLSDVIDGHNGLIEIPEGADIYAISKNWKENIFFAKSGGDTLETFNTINKNDWHQESTLTLENLENNYSILWQRHTHPEELPFIDDEPLQSLNDQYAEIEKVRQSHRTASEIADSALKHIRERAETYDQPTGERSAAKTAKAFNAITGKDITESEVWLLLQLLKDVRQWSREDYHQDSAEDCIAYAALKAESLEGGE